MRSDLWPTGAFFSSSCNGPPYPAPPRQESTAYTGLSHRCSSLDTQAKIQKLSEFIEPVKAQWRTESVRMSLGSYSTFCQFLGLDKAQSYMTSRKAHEIADWGASELDADGLALQSELEGRLKALHLAQDTTWRLLTRTAGLAPAAHQVVPGLFRRAVG